MIEIPSVSPLPFFAISLPCYHLAKAEKIKEERYLLSSLSKYGKEEEFASAYIAWNESGLFFLFDVKNPLSKSEKNDYRQIDSVEILIDTRDRKKSYVDKFCHHFVFFPISDEGCYGKEITRFRGGEIHPHAAKEQLQGSVVHYQGGYEMEIFLLSHFLHGFEQESFDRFGFTYRINRGEKPPQHFSALSEEYSIEKNPACWASLHMV